jgi:hypothetical protein
MSGMRIGVCGIACEVCPKMAKGSCPNGEAGCTPRSNKFCRICTCAFERGVRYCFECGAFPCETTKLGPVSFGYCQYLAGEETS